MAKRMQKRKVRRSRLAASIVWFEIPADDIERAKKFYGSLFGWTFAKIPAAITDYWHIDTGGRMPRRMAASCRACIQGNPSQTMWSSLPFDKAVTKVQKLGGTVCKPKTAVPHMGYFAVCEDSEHNTFGLWEMNERAV